MLKIATWNVNSIRVRLPQVLDWLAQAQPDMLALQETKTIDPDFPIDAITDAGYHASYAGQKTYNGVAILSREPATDVITALPDLDDPQRRILGATINGVRVLNVYVPNGESTDSPKFAYKLNWLEKLHAYAKQQLAQYPAVVLLGDFNIAPDDRDLYDPEKWAGKVLASDEERNLLKKIMKMGFVDTFRQFEQAEESYSWWDYRMASFRRNLGLRIDLVLASQALAKHCTACEIDKTPRAWERPSDHTPVFAIFDNSHLESLSLGSSG